MVACIPIIALIEGIVVGAVVVTSALFIAAVLCHAANPVAARNCGHVGGKVCTLTANAGDNDHCSIGEVLRILHHLVGIEIDIGFRQSPILLRHTNGRTLSVVIGIELAQFVVGLNASIMQASEQVRDGVSIIQSTRTCTAVAGIRRRPAEDVQLRTGSHRQDLVVVLCQNDALLCNLVDQLRCLCRGLLADRATDGNQIQHGGHGAGANKICNDSQRQQNGNAGLHPDEFLFRLGHLPYCEHHDERKHEDNAECNQVIFDIRNHLHYIIHVDGQHNFLPLSFQVVFFFGIGSRMRTVNQLFSHFTVMVPPCCRAAACTPRTSLFSAFLSLPHRQSH